MGKLGFLADFSVEHMQKHLLEVLAGEVQPTERLMLQVSMQCPCGEAFTSPATNDVAISAGEPFRMIDLHVAHGLAMAFLLPWGMETNRTVAEDRIAEIGRLLGAAEDGDSPAAAAEKAVEFVRQLRGGLDLEEDFRGIVAAFDKHKAETGIDEADFGDRAAGQFLMKNNPVHPDAGECTRIFTKIFSTHRV